MSDPQTADPLLTRLLEHATLHEIECRGDPEQLQWANDLRAVVARVRQAELAARTNAETIKAMQRGDRYEEAPI